MDWYQSFREKQIIQNDQLGKQFQKMTALNRKEQTEYRKKIKKRVHEDVVSLASKNQSDDIIREIIEQSLEKETHDLSQLEKESLAREIFDDIRGFGPLERLLQDDSISEIMVNGPKQVYIERKGRLELSSVVFEDDEHVLQVIDRIVTPLGRRCDEANPMVDARLPDGSRVNAIVPPLALNGPSITIRKFNKTPLQISDLIGFNSLSIEMASFLEAAVKSRCNILVSGGTGSGKTTLLNVLSSFIPHDERIVTIEDAAELQLMQEHVVSLEARPANIEGKGAVTIRDLVKNSLRMRPDRIIIGEVRSGEALDMLQAMNTGHDGSLATGHANSARDLIARLETMVMMSGMELPVKAIREQIASAVDLIVQQTRLRDGSRKIVSITEVTGMEGEIVTLQDIFVYRSEGLTSEGKVNGHFTSLGIRPNVLQRFEEQGIAYDNTWFQKERGFR